MEVLYAAVIKDAQPVAEHSRASNRKHNGVDLRALASAIAAQARPGEKVCVSANRLTGSYFQQEPSGLVIVAIGDERAPQRILLQFVKSVDTRLQTSQDYGAVLRDVQEEVAANHDSIRLAQSEINDVKQVLINNIDLLLERGEQVNLLVNRTGDMSESAALFSRQATRLQRRLWFHNVKLLVACGALLLCGGVAAAKVVGVI